VTRASDASCVASSGRGDRDLLCARSPLSLGARGKTVTTALASLCTQELQNHGLRSSPTVHGRVGGSNRRQKPAKRQRTPKKYPSRDSCESPFGVKRKKGRIDPGTLRGNGGKKKNFVHIRARFPSPMARQSVDRLEAVLGARGQGRYTKKAMTNFVRAASPPGGGG